MVEMNNTVESHSFRPGKLELVQLFKLVLTSGPSF